MAYYQGDYYAGDYYQGDPFIGALIGKGVSWLGKKIFKRQMTNVASQRAGAMVLRKSTQFGATATGLALASGLSIPLPGPFRMQPGAILPGGRPFISREPGAAAAAQGGCCPSGFHFNKQVSHAKATFGAPAGTICVRNRTMNVANPRALRRGLRRVAGFGKLAQRARVDVKRAARAIG